MGNIYKALEHGSLLSQGFTLLNSYSLQGAWEYMQKRQQEATSSVRQLFDSRQCQDLMVMLRTSANRGANHSPKLDKLATVVQQHFESHAATEAASAFGGGGGSGGGSATRAIVFTTFRESVRDIVARLEQAGPLIKATEFVGQGTTKAGKGKAGDGEADGGGGGKVRGMAQKEQAAVLEKFRGGELNVIVATSVGEEGLDIAEVDLIVCFDAMASPTRMIQRMGRTGRGRNGRVVILACAGKELADYHKNKDKTHSLHRNLRDASTHFTLHPEMSSRMVPNNTTPQCELRHIVATPPRAPPPPPSGRGGKAQSSKAAGASTSAADADPPLTNAQLLTLARHEMLPEQVRYDRWTPSLTSYLHYQDTLTNVCDVPHSSRTHAFVRAMKRLGGEEPQGGDSLDALALTPAVTPTPPTTGKKKGRSTLPQLFDRGRNQNRQKKATAATASPSALLSPRAAPPPPQPCGSPICLSGDDDDEEVMVVDLTDDSSQPAAFEFPLVTQDVTGCLVMTPDKPMKSEAAGAGGDDPCDFMCSSQSFAHRRLFPQTASTVTWQASGKVGRPLVR